MASYSLLLWLPILPVIRWLKIVENGADYSIQNTTVHALFLPTSREAKYKAKAAIDTLFVRAGDLSSACLVFIGTQLAFGTRQFAISNMVVIVIWLIIVTALSRKYKKVVATSQNETITT
jgi:AAA family ATP:ADP antiporter